ncbi:hypothetical protein F5Y12DRAFT_40449 [Xylaria sp. FL1777]|nr:hypothetical protein F5Y12DRAFT_40449 [Xylaria sp. FL1777]
MTLKVAVTDIECHREVQEGHYDLLGPDGSIILPQAWEQIIQPGWNITMHMWPIAPPPELSEPPGVHPPIPAPGGLFPPPAPPGQGVANEEVVVDEPNSVGERDDDISSGYGSSIGSWKPSRTRRIANAFSALKSTIFRRRRRTSLGTASTASSSLRDVVD